MLAESYDENESLSARDMEQGGTQKEGGEEEVSDMECADKKNHSGGPLIDNIDRENCKLWQETQSSKMSWGEKE